MNWNDRFRRSHYTQADVDALRHEQAPMWDSDLLPSSNFEWDFYDIQPGRWISGNGNDSALEHLATSHLVNIAAMLWRKGTMMRIEGRTPELATAYREKLREVLRVIRVRSE